MFVFMFQTLIYVRAQYVRISVPVGLHAQPAYPEWNGQSYVTCRCRTLMPPHQIQSQASCTSSTSGLDLSLAAG